MKTNLILRKVHLNLSVFAAILAIVLLLSTVLCHKLLGQSLGAGFNIGVLIIMGMMIAALVFGMLTYWHQRRIDTIEKWSLSILGFSILIVGIILLFEVFLKP